MDRPPNLTAEERRVLRLLAEAWNAFASLPDQHPSDPAEFALAIHQAQNLLAFRVARRVDPLLWSASTIDRRL